MATTIFDTNFTKHETNSDLEVMIYANLFSPDDIQFTGYIVLDGSTVQVCSADIILVSNNAQMTQTPFAFLRDVAAGYHNIKFILENREQDNVNLTIKAGSTMKVSELKQGAR